MNISHTIRFWPVGVLVALSGAACDAVDHPVGTEKENLLNEGGGDNAANATTTTTTTGAGGSNAGANSATTGAAGAHDGANSATTGAASSSAWGGLPIPDSCTILPTDEYTSTSTTGGSVLAQCELAVECDDEDIRGLDIDRVTPTWVSAHCMEAPDAEDDSIFCDCANVTGNISYNLTGVTIADACTHALAACLQWPELEASPLECVPSIDDEEVDEPDHCIVHDSCTREGVIGDANFSERQSRFTDCTAGPSGWTCACGSPLYTVGFEIPSDEPNCPDARAWCANQDVERIGTRTCEVTSLYEQRVDSCVATVECQQAVTLSGQEALMYSDDYIRCSTSSDGDYLCHCAQEDAHTKVAAEDLLSACAKTVTLCYGD